MPATVKSLEIDRLPREERLALVQEIWDSIVADQHSTLLSEAQRQELARRVAEDDAAPDDVIPWEQVNGERIKRTRLIPCDIQELGHEK
jgi:putative addiction module component (TIGR02574 family)